jgi:hypothetical protein
MGRRNSKGKGKVVDDMDAIAGREIKIKARLSHSARDVLVRIGDEDNVGLLLRRVRNIAEVCFLCSISFNTVLTYAAAPPTLPA